MAAGQRPINNVVDITNYVMLLTGQPLHAFDWDLVAGGHLVVRRAGDGETMLTLDDAERTLDSDMLLIADDDGPTSIAGIMGGQRSEVQPNTTRVLMEAANWNGPNLQRTSYRLGLRTEASGRFEKGLRAGADDGRPGARGAADARADRRDARSPARSTSAGRARRRRRCGCATRRSRGCSAPRSRSASRRDMLERLEFGVIDNGDGLDVTVPYFRRNDVTREVDLIEEVARLWGLEKLPATIPGHGMSGRLTVEQKLRRRAGDALVGAGLLRGDRLELPGAGDRAQAAARRARRAPAQPAVRGPVGRCARRCSARCWTPCATTPRAGARTCGCSRRARSTSTARTAASRPPRRRARRRFRTSRCTSRR